MCTTRSDWGGFFFFRVMDADMCWDYFTSFQAFDTAFPLFCGVGYMPGVGCFAGRVAVSELWAVYWKREKE
ncbi:hypothetical protein CC86DRAFT_146555 [Ophiobolus disseminans]|uniref:Uncharacterized protein n=1 Tax=Ophiobolus disseminans TaxID=1469910 RepID=A0A6A6ZEE5_9PLEO|nr:hypothetical protein CC86DRAFT_146555 [Ophiobolus disseminans]